MRKSIVVLSLALLLGACERKNQVFYGDSAPTPPAVSFLFDATGTWTGTYTVTDQKMVTRTFPITLVLQHGNLRSLWHNYINGTFSNGDISTLIDGTINFGTGDGMILHFIGSNRGSNPYVFIDLTFEGKLTDYPNQKVMGFKIQGSDRFGYEKGSGVITRP